MQEPLSMSSEESGSHLPYFKIPIRTLNDVPLDWAVAKALKLRTRFTNDNKLVLLSNGKLFNPSTNKKLAAQIIKQSRIKVQQVSKMTKEQIQIQELPEQLELKKEIALNSKKLNSYKRSFKKSFITKESLEKKLEEINNKRINLENEISITTMEINELTNKLKKLNELSPAIDDKIDTLPTEKKSKVISKTIKKSAKVVVDISPTLNSEYIAQKENVPGIVVLGNDELEVGLKCIVANDTVSDTVNVSCIEK